MVLRNQKSSLKIFDSDILLTNIGGKKMTVLR